MYILENLQNFFSVRYAYSDPGDRLRARGLVGLAMFTLLLGLGVVLLAVVIYSGTVLDNAMLVSGPVLVLVALAVTRILNAGRLGLASWFYTGMVLLVSAALVGVIGMETPAVISLVMPVVVSGVLMDRRGGVLLSLLTLLAVLLLGVSEVVIFARAEAIDWITVLSVGVVLVFVALVQFLFINEIRRLFTQINLNEQQVNLITALSSQLIVEGHPDALVGGFSRTIHSAFDLQQVQVYLQDPDNPAVIQLRGGAGLATQRLLAEGRALTAIADSPISRAFRQGQVIEVGRQDRTVDQVEFMPGTESELIIPLRFGQHILGVVDVQSAARRFDDETSTLLVTLARQLSATLQNALLGAQLNRQFSEQEQLNAHMQELSAEVQQLRQQATGVVWSRFFRERGADVIGFDVPAKGAAPVPAADLPVDLSSALLSHEPQIIETAAGFQLTVPIVLREQVLGAMEFQLDTDQANADRALDLAQAIAERLSTALENARLVEQTQAFAHREQAVGSVADRLQTAANLEDLLSLAAAEFNDVLGGTYTHIRLQLRDDADDDPAARTHAASPVASRTGTGQTNGGGAA